MLDFILPLLALFTLSVDEVVLVEVKAGTYTVGEIGHPRNPLRTIGLDAFEIGRSEVTNAQFAKFVEATGYLTDAERSGFGMTFQEGMDDWKWDSTPGATWRFPFGPSRAGIEGKQSHPVTQISFRDAEAYCRWAGFRLPSVEEWEVAARADTPSEPEAFQRPSSATPMWPWGEVYSPQGRLMANTWQGSSHRNNTMEDGHLYTAPVGQFPPNAWGLHDVIGNVFEYCTDERARDRNGDLWAAGRGGSWWCSNGTCDYFNLIDIGQMHPRATLANQGFRVARSL